MFSADTSSLMEAWIRRYPPDVLPPLWERLSALIAQGRLIASEEVGRDLEKQSDDLHAWAESQSGLFVPTEEAIQLQVKQILANHKKLVDTTKGRSGSDPFVIAVARSRGCAVVTEEKASRNPEKRPKIPDVCRALGVESIDMLGLIRRVGWVFK